MKKDSEECGYYFVDHEKRVIFWFQDHKSDLLMCNIRGVERKSHVSEFFRQVLSIQAFVTVSLPGYALESQYWSV